MRLILALSGIQQMSNSIILSGVVSTFPLFTANHIYCHWQKIVDYNQLWSCDNATTIPYSGWEYL